MNFCSAATCETFQKIVAKEAQKSAEQAMCVSQKSPLPVAQSAYATCPLSQREAVKGGLGRTEKAEEAARSVHFELGGTDRSTVPQLAHAHSLPA